MCCVCFLASFDEGLLRNPSGETGIRTPETLLAFTRFPGVPLQPLEHLSFAHKSAFFIKIGYKITTIFSNTQIFCKKNANLLRLDGNNVAKIGSKERTLVFGFIDWRFRCQLRTEDDCPFAVTVVDMIQDALQTVVFVAVFLIK